LIRGREDHGGGGRREHWFADGEEVGRMTDTGAFENGGRKRLTDLTQKRRAMRG